MPSKKHSKKSISVGKDELDQLFASAASKSTISQATASFLSGHLGEVVIAGAAGRALEELETSEVMLVTILLDRSSSISGLQKAVKAGYNTLVDGLRTAREADSILTALWTFNHDSKVLHSYVPIDEAAKLSGKNYRVSGGTALYDTWCDALASNLAYAEQLRDGGTPCRSIVVVITDGEDTSSRRTAADCARLGKDLLRSEQFVLGFVGVGGAIDFRRIARSMGIPDDSVLVGQTATPDTVQHVFQLVTRSVTRVSQTLIGPGKNLGFFAP